MSIQTIVKGGQALCPRRTGIGGVAIRISGLVVFMLLATPSLSAAERGQPWQRHTIDSTSRGADGVRLADVNGDGRLDIATGWEEGGKIRVYLHPGPKKSRQAWPAVTVGKVRSPEDAVFADLDGDGAFDVVSSCEGRNRTMFVHWAPAKRSAFLDEASWETAAIPASAGKRSWMFSLPLQIDGKRGIDLVAGAKGKAAEVGWFESPADPRRLADWKWHSIYKAGWIMSLIPRDMDGDKDIDLLITDRKGKNRGCKWLENPGPGAAADAGLWNVHAIGGIGQEVMFMTTAHLDGKGTLDVISAVRGGDLLLFQRQGAKGKETSKWSTRQIRMPANTGTGKGVAAGDIDLDGQVDIVFSCENARDKSGVMWLAAPDWDAREISGRDEGIKFDRIELLDLDADGDLDVLTCEERDNLGVIWYENPHR